MRASKSATGSVKLILYSPVIVTRLPWLCQGTCRDGLRKLLAASCWLKFVVKSTSPKPKRLLRTYQDDLETPGISPFNASPRKHRRQKPNLRRYPRGRPQMLQRLRCWVENLGFSFVLAIFAVVAIFLSI